MRSPKIFFLAAIGLSGCSLLFDGSDLRGTHDGGGGSGGDGGSCGAAATLSFGAPQPFPTGNAFPIQLAAGDLDGDGKTDVVVANFGDSGSSTMPSSAILWGLGKDGFGVPQSTSLPAAHAVAIADFDGNQKLDVVVVGNDASSPPGSNTIRVLLNQGGRNFAPQTFADSGGPYAVAAADIDADGHMDFAVGNSYQSTVTVFYGSGDGSTFTPAPYVACPTARTCSTDDLGIFALAIGDLDHNGLLDLVTSNNVDDTVSVLPNGGARGFSTDMVKNIPVGTNPAGLALADLNGDLFADIVVANANANNLSVLLSGGGTFNMLPIDVDPDPNASPGGVAIADVNGDGILDLITANYDNSNMGNDAAADGVAVLLGRVGGTFMAAQKFPAGLQPTAVVVGDFNGDCRPDIVVANHLLSGSVSVLFNTSN